MSRIFPLSFFSLLLFGSLLLSNLSRVSLGAAPPPSSVPSYSKPYVPSQAGTVNASPPVPPPPSQYSPPPPSQYPPPPPPPSYGSPPPAAQNSYSPPSVPSYSQSPPPPQQGYIPPQGGTPPYNQQQPGVGVPPGGQPPPPPSGTNQYGQAASYVPATRSSISSSSSFIETSPHVQPPPAPSAAGGDQGSSSSNGQRAKPLWQESVGSVELARHSWTAPLTYENHLGEWDLAMATVPTEHYVVLTPAVANRTGQFWHRQPLLTSNFEIQFGFGVHGDDSAYIDFISSGGRKNRVTRPAGGQQAKAGGAASGPYIGKPEGFALWYVYDEYARVYPKSKAEETQWNLFGYKNRPRGLGVFFKVFDRYGQLRPSISVAWNDENGNRALDPIRDVPLPSGIFYRYRNLNEPAVFKLAAGPTGIVGEIRLTPGGAWLTCFHLKDVRLKPGGYLGFTAYNGPEPHLLQTAASPAPPTPGSTPGGGIADLVVLYFVKVWNLDLSVRGEGDEILDKEMADVPVDDLLKSHSVHKSQKELSDSLKQLTRMLYKHIAEQSPREQTMQRTINSLNTQVSRMATEIKDMKREILMQIQRSSGSATGKGSTEGSSGSISDQALHTVRSELHGLKSLLAKHSQLHKDSLQTLHQKVEAARAAAPSIAMTPELREFANRARDLEQTIAKKEHFSYLMTIVLIIVLLIFALFVWKRFRDMEKKHLL